MCCVLGGVNLAHPTIDKPLSEKTNTDITMGVFIPLAIGLGLCLLPILFIPSLSQMRELLIQIKSIGIIFIYTIALISFYILVPQINGKSSVNDTWYTWMQYGFILLGIAAFSYSGFQSYAHTYDITYERIKSMITIMCFIAVLTTFTSADTGPTISKWFSGSLISMIIVFAYLMLAYGILLLLNPVGLKQLNPDGQMSNVVFYGSSLFALFITIMAIVISVKFSGKDDFESSSKFKALIAFTTIISFFAIMVIGTTALSNIAASGGPKPSMRSSETWKIGLNALGGLGISAYFFYFIATLFHQWSGGSTTSRVKTFGAAFLIIALFVFAYRILFVKLPNKHGEFARNPVFTLLASTILYIPCLIGDLTNGIPWFTWLLLTVCILLIVALQYHGHISNIFSSMTANLTGGQQLVSNVGLPLNSQHLVASYPELHKQYAMEPSNPHTDPEYLYGLSAWFNVAALGSNTSPAYNKYTQLLSFGAKPLIEYNSSKTSLRITVQSPATDENKAMNEVYEIDDPTIFPLERWNNIIVNYSGSTCDIFINGKLLKTITGSLPYYTLDGVIVGADNGLLGTVKDVVYYGHTLTGPEIWKIYALHGKTNE